MTTRILVACIACSCFQWVSPIQVKGQLKSGLAGTTAFAQSGRPTIPEALARAGRDMGRFFGVGGGTLGDPSSSEYLHRFTDRLLSDTDAIVRGRVGQPLPSYLSEDQMQVYTDYPIADSLFLYRSDVSQSPRPGMLPPATVTLLGGKITINGLHYTSDHMTLRALDPGTECLFLLKRVGDRYFVAGKYDGAFGIKDGLIAPIRQGVGFPPAYIDAPATKAAEEMVARRLALHQ